MQYFSSRYDLNEPLAKDVETVDFLFTGLVVGFDMYLIQRLVENNPEIDHMEFAKRLIKWSGIKIETKKQFYDALEDILGWDRDKSLEVYNYGIKTLYLFRPEDFYKFNLTFEKAKWN